MIKSFPCFILKKDSKGEWYWVYQANNHEIVARSSESYKNKDDCKHSIHLIQKSKDLSIYEDVA